MNFMNKQKEEMEGIAGSFAVGGEFVDGEEIETGLINSTFLAKFRHEDGELRSYILQRINGEVFKDPRAVMRNVERVTRHINAKVMRKKTGGAGQTLSLFPSRDGKAFISGPNGGLWRCYNFIEGCQTYDVVENERQAYEAGKAFGAFQELVSDLPPEEISETIPDFHHTPKRLLRLREAVEQDAAGRLAEVEKEVAFIEARAEWTGRLVDLQAAGKIPLRVTHNDTKFNNVMIDEESDRAVCVIDLDTVMPGLVHYDFGDLVRTATSPAAEDERDLSKVEMRMPMFSALAEGYLEAAGSFLTAAEIEQLAFSAKLITLEVGIRFLTDYLEGDRYFKTTRAGQNLDRCRAQLRLVEGMEGCFAEMEAVIGECQVPSER